jgi:hypothetical protein
MAIPYAEGSIGRNGILGFAGAVPRGYFRSELRGPAGRSDMTVKITFCHV